MKRDCCKITNKSLVGYKMISVKRLSSIVIILLLCSIIFAGCKNNAPEIITIITLSNITEGEYSKIGEQSKPEGVSISDLRKLYVNVKITNSINAEERTVIIPDIIKIIDGFDRIRTTGGGSFEQNNIRTENTAEYMSYAIFDTRNLSDYELRSLFDDDEIYIAYKLKNSNLVESKISIGKNITN